MPVIARINFSVVLPAFLSLSVTLCPNRPLLSLPPSSPPPPLVTTQYYCPLSCVSTRQPLTPPSDFFFSRAAKSAPVLPFSYRRVSGRSPRNHHHVSTNLLVSLFFYTVTTASGRSCAESQSVPPTLGQLLSHQSRVDANPLYDHATYVMQHYSFNSPRFSYHQPITQLYDILPSPVRPFLV